MFLTWGQNLKKIVLDTGFSSPTGLQGNLKHVFNLSYGWEAWLDSSKLAILPEMVRQLELGINYQWGTQEDQLKR